MLQFFLSTMRSGFRSRVVLILMVLGLMLVVTAFLAASFSPRQPRTVTLDVGFSGLRFCLILLGTFWVQELVGREVERRTVLYALAYPISRSAYLGGRFLGVVGLLAIASAVLGSLLWLSALNAGGSYDQSFTVHLGLPYWVTIVGFWMDAIVVASFAVFISSISTVQMLPVFLGIAFGLAGKGLGAATDYLSRGADGDARLVEQFGLLIDLIRWVLPDLSALDWRVWPMYGSIPQDMMLPATLAFAMGYVVLMLGLSALYFGRREFF